MGLNEGPIVEVVIAYDTQTRVIVKLTANTLLKEAAVHACSTESQSQNGWVATAGNSEGMTSVSATAESTDIPD